MKASLKKKISTISAYLSLFVFIGVLTLTIEDFAIRLLVMLTGYACMGVWFGWLFYSPSDCVDDTKVAQK